MKKMQNICLGLPPELKAELQKEATVLGLNLNSYIRLILTQREK